VIAVVGGTGRRGRLVTSRLVADGQRVRVVARSAPETPVPGAEFVVGDVRDPATLPHAVAGAGVVVVAMHGMDPNAGESPATVDRDGSRALFTAARAEGADIVLVSVIGASTDHVIELVRMKAAAEDTLRSGSPNDPPDWTIVRSAAFAEMWLDLFRSTAATSGVPKVMGPGRNPISFVSVNDVAVAVAHAATDRSLRGRVIEVAGENLSQTDLAALVTAPGKHPARIPTAAVWAVGTLLRPLRPGLARVARQTLAMEHAFMQADPQPAHETYPWLPHTPIAQRIHP
jgi:NADH dehydrogenase